MRWRLAQLGKLGVLCTLLVACSDLRWRPRPVPFVGANAQLQLHQAVEFPAGSTRVYFQHGRPVTQRQLTVWEHHCALAIDHALETDLTLTPANYIVADTQRRTTVGEWGYGVMTYENTFLLASSARPLYALYCELWVLGNGYDPRQHPGPEQLAEILGPWLTVLTDPAQ